MENQHFFVGKVTIDLQMAMFNGYVSHYQRVNCGDFIRLTGDLVAFDGNLVGLHVVILDEFSHDLTTTEPWNHWLIREIIPKWPWFRLVKYSNLPR